MKKLLTITLSLLMIFSFVACSADAKITHGTIEGNVYKNDSTGITFTAPDSWTYMTDEEIAEIADFTADKFVDEKFADAIAEMESFTEMMVSDNATGTNVNIMFENLSTSGTTNISTEDYLDTAMEQLKSATEGMTVELVGSEDVSLCGENYLRAELSTSLSGISMSQYMYIRKISNYMIVVTVTIVSGYEISDIEAMFS